MDDNAKQEQLFGEMEKIKQYLRDLPPDILGVDDTQSIEILKMTPGSYNLNFHVRVNQKEFIFRINIDQQSGLANQIEYEFKILKFLENHDVAPRAFHFDDSQRHFEFGILIEEYLTGPPLSLEAEEISDVAGLLARLHSLKPGELPFITWRDPLADTYALTRCDLEGYEARRAPNRKTIRLAKKLLAKFEKMISEYSYLYDADSLNHTDLACDNFIKTSAGLRLIDWEKPRVDDHSYDICCFLSEPAEMWCSAKVLNPAQRMNFINTYAAVSGKDADQLLVKVNIREPLVSLHWILWGATKLCDLLDRSTSPRLVQAHQDKRVRYERIANPQNIEKLLDLDALAF